MAQTRSRSPSDTEGPPTKRRRRSGSFSSEISDASPYFATNLLSDSSTQLHSEQYHSAQPFKHVVIDKIFQESLLTKVKDEILGHISFSEKETDIYKVLQSGDLASLNYLKAEQLQLFPSLQILRDSLYSKEFREFIRKVTGCGPLSSRRDRRDMSINSYKKSCHLLNHDDVIGSRRVSYILYMPLPIDQPWQPEWGGALELYPVQPGSNPPEPAPIPSKTISPSWGQWIMFEVQPGKSFHSVEEVVVDTDKFGRQRLSISGWFHKAQPGEEDYEPEEEEVVSSSSLQQLIASRALNLSYPESDPTDLTTCSLSKEDTEFLSKYLNPTYLTQKALAALAKRFAEESSLELHRFLLESLAEKLRTGLLQRDEEDGLGAKRPRPMPSHSSGSSSQWHVKGPPHKHRYCVLSTRPPSGRADSPNYAAEDSPEWILRRLQDNLLPSEAFRSWMAAVTSLIPMKHSVEARRFRPGLDYTLATSEQNETRLDVCLGLTPPVERVKGKPFVGSWDSGEWGGWECYLAPPEEEEDPAVYRASKSQKKPATNGTNETNGVNGVNGSNGTNGVNGSNGSHAENSEEQEMVVDDESGTLLTVQPGFNRLLLVLRDERVLRFVKYLSAEAQGCRWDVCGEWEVGMVEEHEVL